MWRWVGPSTRSTCSPVNRHIQYPVENRTQACQHPTRAGGGAACEGHERTECKSEGRAFQAQGTERAEPQSYNSMAVCGGTESKGHAQGRSARGQDAAGKSPQYCAEDRGLSSIWASEEHHVSCEFHINHSEIPLQLQRGRWAQVAENKRRKIKKEDKEKRGGKWEWRGK